MRSTTLNRSNVVVAVVLAAVVSAIVAPVAGASAATKSIVGITASTPATVAYSKSAVITGRISASGRAISGARVKITQQSGGSWTLVASTTTNAQGDYSAGFIPLAAVTVRAELASTATTYAATSGSFTIGVQPQIYATRISGDGSEAVGTVRTFTGEVHSGLAGRRIKVERFEPSGWVQAGQSYIASTGSFRIPVSTTRFGNQAFRVVMPSGAGLLVKQVGPFNVGSYGGAATYLTTVASCFGASALPGPCVNAALGTSITPSISKQVYAKDTQGAFSCYTSDIAKPTPMCSEGSTRGDALRVAVTGDSHGAMLLAGLRPYLTALNWRLDSYVAQGCVLATPISGDPCESREKDLNARLQHASYDVLFVTSWRGAPREEGRPDPRVAGYSDSWKKLIADGTTVVAVADGPTFAESALECIDHSATYTAATKCQTSKALAYSVQDPLPLAAALTPGAVLVNEVQHVCSTTTCTPIVGHVMAYRDSHHYSATFSKSLVPFIVQDAASKL